MINLLPPEYKKELNLEEKFRLSMILGICIFVFLVSLALMLATIRIYLAGQIQEEKFFSSLSTKVTQTNVLVSQDIRNTNTNFSRLLQFYKRRPLVSTTIDHISQDLPFDISLDTLDISSSAVSLQGFSPTRDTLLVFRNNLLKDTTFSNIDFPISNLVNEANIHFVIRMSVKTQK